MKILFFDDWKLGVLEGDTVVDVSDVVKDIPHLGPHDLINGLITRWAPGLAPRHELHLRLTSGRGRCLRRHGVSVVGAHGGGHR